MSGDYLRTIKYSQNGGSGGIGGIGLSSSSSSSSSNQGISIFERLKRICLLLYHSSHGKKLVKLMSAIIGFIILLAAIIRFSCSSSSSSHDNPSSSGIKDFKGGPPVMMIERRITPCISKRPCKIAIIADLDVASKTGTPEKPEFFSLLGIGQLSLESKNTFLTWNPSSISIKGKYGEQGRGMELSELVLYNNHLLTFDDRTGIVYDLLSYNPNLYLSTQKTSQSSQTLLRHSSSSSISSISSSSMSPMLLKEFIDSQSTSSNDDHVVVVDDILSINTTDWIILPMAQSILTETSLSPKGMKIEWATVKDDNIYVGSFGKEFTSSDGAHILNENNLWVVSLNCPSEITCNLMQRHNWTDYYTRIRKHCGADFPGYMIHEAINWSPKLNRWVVLPRRISKEPYDEIKDEKRGATTVLLASEDFKNITSRNITDLPGIPDRGFSTFKFVPGTSDSIVIAVRSAEDSERGLQNSFISVFNIIDGAVLIPEIEIPFEYKFEGIEIW